MESNMEHLQYPIGRYHKPDAHTPELIQEWIKYYRYYHRGWMCV